MESRVATAKVFLVGILLGIAAVSAYDYLTTFEVTLYWKPGEGARQYRISLQEWEKQEGRFFLTEELSYRIPLKSNTQYVAEVQSLREIKGKPQESEPARMFIKTKPAIFLPFRERRVLAQSLPTQEEMKSKGEDIPADWEGFVIKAARDFFSNN